MRARVGDRLVVPGHKVGDGERVGEVVGVRGEGGTPPFVVRWQGHDNDAVFFPGPEAAVEHRGPDGP